MAADVVGFTSAFFAVTARSDLLGRFDSVVELSLVAMKRVTKGGLVTLWAWGSECSWRSRYLWE